MAAVTYLILLVGTVVVMLVLSTHLHEYTHYAILRSATANVTVKYHCHVVPHRASLDSPFDVSPQLLRISAVAPIGWLFVAITAFQSLQPNSPGEYIVIFSAATPGVAISPADIFAAIYPVEFQHRSEEGDNFSHMQTARELLQRLF